MVSSATQQALKENLVDLAPLFITNYNAFVKSQNSIPAGLFYSVTK